MGKARLGSRAYLLGAAGEDKWGGGVGMGGIGERKLFRAWRGDGGNVAA